MGEEARLKYRYLDLRREPDAVRAFACARRSRSAAREALYAHDFVEIETPTLTRSTPEGARDFLVPARLTPGSWYALPQSPQLFKQLLMVAGMERYYQIARCYRDEDFRADRQPEFTQLDIEMSFVDQDDVIDVAEDVLQERVGAHRLRPVHPDPAHDLQATRWRRYGSDKPDLRFGLELTELTEYFKDTTFRVFQAPYVGAVVMPGGGSQPRRTFDKWQEWAKAARRQGPGLRHDRRGRHAGRTRGQEHHRGRARGPGGRHRREARRLHLLRRRQAPTPSRALLGAARLEIGKRCGLIDADAWAFAWVVDAPLFKPSGEAPRPRVTSRWATPRGPPCTTPSPRPSPSASTPSTPTRATPWPTPTTSSATATRSAAARSVSTAATSRTACST